MCCWEYMTAFLSAMLTVAIGLNIYSLVDFNKHLKKLDRAIADTEETKQKYIELKERTLDVEYKLETSTCILFANLASSGYFDNAVDSYISHALYSIDLALTLDKFEEANGLRDALLDSLEKIDDAKFNYGEWKNIVEALNVIKKNDKKNFIDNFDSFWNSIAQYIANHYNPMNK